MSSATSLLGSQTVGVHPPPQSIETVETAGRRKLLEFGGKHRFWFPTGMDESAELWSEYLVGFWNHPMNFHQYTRGGVTLGSGDVVLDCGACEGFFTRAALEAGAVKVICVEPSSAMADCLRATFRDEIAEGRVVVAPVALGSFSGSAGFASAEDDAFAGHFEGGGGDTVEVTTLAELAKEHGKPTFIKMDLEGSEYQALSGGVEFLRESHPKLGITTYHNPWDFAVISSLLEGVGYSNVRPYGVTLRGESTPRPVMVHAW
ncbi:MAG: FkbM family methyltransferase [Luteolibacter sp.]